MKFIKIYGLGTGFWFRRVSELNVSGLLNYWRVGVMIMLYLMTINDLVLVTRMW